MAANIRAGLENLHRAKRESRYGGHACYHTIRGTIMLHGVFYWFHPEDGFVIESVVLTYPIRTSRSLQLLLEMLISWISSHLVPGK